MKSIRACALLVLLGLTYGCGGGSGGSIGAGTVTPTATFNVSGTVTANGTGLSGATVTLNPTGGSPTTTTTGSSGTFTFTGKAKGNYTISAAMAGYAMSAQQSITINGADVTGIAFTATSTAGPFVVDTFQGTGTGTRLDDHVGDTGAGWQHLSGTNTAYIDGPNSAVYSTSDAIYYNSAVLPVYDYSVIATFRMNSPASGVNCYVSGRTNHDSNARYIAGHTHGLGWGLYYVDGLGHEALLAPGYGDTLLTANTTYTVELRMVGSSIAMYVNDVLAASATDTALATGDHVGLEITGTGPGSDGSYEIYDFEVTSPSVR